MGKWIGLMDFVCKDKNGNILWQELNVPNALANEGEESVLDVYLRAAAAPAAFYIRLYNTIPVITSTLASLSANEASGGGYAAQTVARDSTASGWPALALDSGYFMATAKKVTFTATTGFGPVTYATMSTTSNDTGKLISFVALSQTRTLGALETLDVTYKVKLQ